MMYAVEMTSVGMMYIPSFMKIVSSFQVILGRIYSLLSSYCVNSGH
jgi:hypothetical protein